MGGVRLLGAVASLAALCLSVVSLNGGGDRGGLALPANMGWRGVRGGREGGDVADVDWLTGRRWSADDGGRGSGLAGRGLGLANLGAGYTGGGGAWDGRGDNSGGGVGVGGAGGGYNGRQAEEDFRVDDVSSERGEGDDNDNDEAGEVEYAAGYSVYAAAAASGTRGRDSRPRVGGDDGGGGGGGGGGGDLGGSGSPGGGGRGGGGGGGGGETVGGIPGLARHVGALGSPGARVIVVTKPAEWGLTYLQVASIRRWAPAVLPHVTVLTYDQKAGAYTRPLFSST